MSLHLRTFGTPCLLGGAGEIRLNAKELALLVYLRVTARPHTRGELGKLLWGNISIGRNHSVNTAISALRRALPDGALPPGANPVELAQELACDADALLNTAAKDELAVLSHALEIHRAPFLEGFEFQLGEGAEGFVSWLQERRMAFTTALQQRLEEQLASAAGEKDWKRVRALAQGGCESLPGWTGGVEWTSQANRAREHSRRFRAGAALAACGVGIVLLTGPGTPGAAPTCRAGEARAQLVRQIYPAESNQAIRRGVRYTPTWFLKNVGSCAWSAGARVTRTHAFGPAKLSAVGALTIGRAIQPNRVARVGVRVYGPQEAGRYGEDWILTDAFAKPIRIDGGAILQVRFRVLPPRLPTCRAGQINAEFVGQSHSPRDTHVRPGERVPVSWLIENRGDCTWDSSVALRFRSASGPRLSDSTLSVVPVNEPVPPSYGYAFEVPMHAPQVGGSYLESWELIGPDGHPVRISDASEVDVRLVVSPAGEIHPTAQECAPGEEVAAFMNTETVMDGSTVSPGARIPKQWTVQNLGACTWPAGALRLKGLRSDPEFKGRSLPDAVTDRPVPPGGIYTFRAPFTGPRAPGYYHVHWQLYNRKGDSVFISNTWTLYAEFEVRGGTEQ